MDLAEITEKFRTTPLTEFEVSDVLKECHRLTQLWEEQGAEIESMKEQVGDLESQNEDLQIEHDVMFARIRDANGHYTPQEVSKLIDSEIALTRHSEEKALMVAQMVGLDAELSQAREEVESERDNEVP